MDIVTLYLLSQFVPKKVSLHWLQSAPSKLPSQIQEPSSGLHVPLPEHVVAGTHSAAKEKQDFNRALWQSLFH